jgi:hypothetical protein
MDTLDAGLQTWHDGRAGTTPGAKGSTLLHRPTACPKQYDVLRHVWWAAHAGRGEGWTEHGLSTCGHTAQ